LFSSLPEEELFADTLSDERPCFISSFTFAPDFSLFFLPSLFLLLLRAEVLFLDILH